MITMTLCMVVPQRMLRLMEENYICLSQVPIVPELRA